MKPIEPVLAIALEAQRRGIPMAIASGGGRVHVLGAIEANSLERMFEAFICAEVLPMRFFPPNRSQACMLPGPVGRFASLA